VFVLDYEGPCKTIVSLPARVPEQDELSARPPSHETNSPQLGKVTGVSRQRRRSCLSLAVSSFEGDAVVCRWSDSSGAEW